MKSSNLPPEEQELLISVENDEWLSVANLEQEIKLYQSCAESQIGEAQDGRSINCLVVNPKSMKLLEPQIYPQ